VALPAGRQAGRGSPKREPVPLQRKYQPRISWNFPVTVMVREHPVSATVSATATRAAMISRFML